MNIGIPHSQLLEKWKNCRPDYEDFCYDGILSETIWSNLNPKILFLLKESNAGFKDITANIPIEGYEPKKGNSNTFWRNINLWSYIITEYWNRVIPAYETALSNKENPVNAIAYVNVKKWAQNRSKSNNNEIVRYAIRDKEFLVNQIELINPDVIICGGTINSLKQLFLLQSVSNHVFQSEID